MPNPTPEPSLPEAVTDEELENIKARIARYEDWSVRVDCLIARIDQERQARKDAEEALARMDSEVADHISAFVDTQSRLAAAKKVLEAARRGRWDYGPIFDAVDEYDRAYREVQK